MLLPPNFLQGADSCIAPTHTCFDDAAELLLMNQAFNRFLGQLYLGHLLVESLRKPEGIYAHAIILQLEGNIAWQAGYYADKKIYYGLSPKEFGCVYRVHKQRWYTLEDFATMNYLYQTFGPWDEEMGRLCNDKKS